MSLVMSLFAFGADTDAAFEKEINAFPESYKVYLRTLHEKYPDWSFVPMMTGLDWEDVINGEYGTKSLVAAGSVVSDIFKSRASGHYNKSEGYYIQMDGGFVTANKLAVSYFMDPRNFLTEDNIFQFELLSFDERHTVEAIETVLKGSFMENTVIKYYDKNGKQNTMDVTYSEAIYNAGVKYNINPCYLASKILNEVGSKGSASVSGKHSTYPGVYNFYNIGATDGTGAIARGLQWANTSGNYGRPWTDPVKSINGGAEFLASSYIKNGQFTGYLQRFNVNPDSYYSLYTHQYMTNLTGALSQGYSTYKSYAQSGTLNNSFVFSIPVFENMPEGDGEKAYVSDSINQKGKINQTSCYVRTGPSTNNAKLYDKFNLEVLLNKTITLTILEKVETDAEYYSSILTYPYWYKVSFTYNSQKLTGYVPAGFVDITTQIVTPKGQYDLTFLKSSGDIELSMLSEDESILTVKDKDTVEFKANGKTTLVIYDSLGKLDKVYFNVTSSPSISPVSDISVTTGKTNAKIEFIKNSDAKTNLILSYYNGDYISDVSTDNASYNFKNLKPAGIYTVNLRAQGSNAYTVNKKISFAIQPEKVTSLKYTVDSNGKTILSWNPVECTGYAVYSYDTETKKHTRMATVKDGKTSYTVPEEFEQYGIYCVRPYIAFDGKNTYGDNSDKLTTKIVPSTPGNFAVSSITESGYKLSWSKADKATGYSLYSVSGTKETLIKNLTETSYTVSALNPGDIKTYVVKAYNDEGAEKVYSEPTELLTAITKPKKVTGLKRSSLLFDGVTLSWNKAEGASSYNVYWESETDKKALLVSTDSISYVVTGLKQNTQYNFYVEAAASENDVSTVAAQTKINLTTYLSPTESFYIKSSGVTDAVLAWKENAEAKSYQIYKYNSSKKEYELYKNATGNSLKITSLYPGEENRFKIRCVTPKSDGSNNYSKFSAALKVKTQVPKFESTFKASSVGETSFTLSWNADSTAYGYNIYRYNGSWEKIAGTKNTSFKVSGIPQSDLSFYSVSALYKISGKSFESEKSDSFTVATKPKAVSSLKATAGPNTVDLSWKEVENASYYRVYLYDSEKNKYIAQLDTDKTTASLSGLGYNKAGKVRIRTYTVSDCGTVYSGLTQVDFTTLPKNIANVKLSKATTNSQTIYWSNSTGATHYYVYRYNGSSYKRIAIVEGRSYTVKNLKSKTNYYYKIRPVVMENGKTILYGNPTKAYKFKTK